MNKLNDNKLKFYEKSHKYKIGKKTLKSVTTFVDEHFEPFDAKGIARKLASFWHNKKNKRGVRYWLNDWKKSAEHGTKVHNEIEEILLFNKKTIVDEETIMNMPKATEAKTLQGLKYFYEEISGLTKDFYPEIRIYSEKYGLAGTIDLMVMTGEKECVLVDWKTNKAIKKDAYENKKGIKKSTSNIADCNYNHYALQLNMYAYILEKEYGIKVNGMYLVHLKDENYKVYSINKHEKLVKDMLEEEENENKNI